MLKKHLLIEAKIIPPRENGNSYYRLIFYGEIWDEWDLSFCIHGEKLRWECDNCDYELMCEQCQHFKHEKCVRKVRKIRDIEGLCFCKEC